MKNEIGVIMSVNKIQQMVENGYQLIIDIDLLCQFDVLETLAKVIAPVLHHTGTKLVVIEDKKHTSQLPEHVMILKKYSLLTFTQNTEPYKKKAVIQKNVSNKYSIRIQDTTEQKQYPEMHKVFSFPQKVFSGDRNFPLTGEFPALHSTVYDADRSAYSLTEQIGRTGGEGSVYATRDGLACKIYKADKLTLSRYSKIKLLTENGINIKRVSFPTKMAFNGKGEFVGYFMPKAKGYELKTSMFIPPLLKKRFLSWNRWHLVKTAMTIARTVERIHNHNIVLGDINPSNILIQSEDDLSFIDTDSFQIEEYPCNVGMVPYTRPAHHGKSYKSYLRTKEDDIFALTTLIFQILLPGKLPYSFSGGGSEKENMRPENFAYKCGRTDRYKNAPDGQWVYIWSHLPKKLKELFCKVFRNDQTIAITHLIKALHAYLYQIEQGKQSDEIFPLTFKQVNVEGKLDNDAITKFDCKDCGRKFAIPNEKLRWLKTKGYTREQYCETCRTYHRKKTCTVCNKPINENGQTKCKHCRGTDIRCIVCGNDFFFSQSEKEFYDKRGLSRPRRCKKCRN